MPAYFSVFYTFPYSTFSQNFVSEVYSTIFNHFPFKSGYWGSENNTLEEIISWNSTLLSKKFELGINEHVKEDYKQILLDSPLYSHLRLFWIYQSNEITLHMILPEYDVILDDNSWRFNGPQLAPILNLSIELWSFHKVSNVQTYHELGAPVELGKVLKGEQPSTEPFCIVGINIFEKLENYLESTYYTKRINNGVLIVEQEYASLIKEDR